MPHASRSWHPHNRILLVAGTTMAVALTACGSNPDKPGPPTATASPAPTGAVTRSQASTIVDRYEAINSQANKTQDPALLGTVEGGQLYEQSTADYRILPTWSKKDQEYYEKPFTYRDRSYYIPQDESWFAVKATASGSKTQALLVFDKTDGRHFKMVAAVYADQKNSIPAVDTSNHGLASAVEPSTHVGALAPDQASAAFEDLYETGGKRTGTKLASTTATRTAVSTYRERTTYKNAKYATMHWEATKASHPKIYVLRLRNGGALAVFPTAHNRMEQLKDGYIYSGNIKLSPGSQAAVFNKTPRVAILNEYQGQALAQFSPAGEPRVLGVEYQLVDSR